MANKISENSGCIPVIAKKNLQGMPIEKKVILFIRISEKFQTPNKKTTGENNKEVRQKR